MLLGTLSRSDWIALGAVLIAGGSLILAIFALVLAWRADARAGRAETRDDDARADEHPAEQPTIVKADARDGRRAELRLAPGIAVPDGSDRRRYAVTVRNVGAVRADDVRVTVEDENGETVSVPSSSQLLSLTGGEESQSGASVTKDVARPGLWFALSWRDADGAHHVRTDVSLPS